MDEPKYLIYKETDRRNTFYVFCTPDGKGNNLSMDEIIRHHFEIPGTKVDLGATIGTIPGPETQLGSDDIREPVTTEELREFSLKYRARAKEVEAGRINHATLTSPRTHTLI